MEQSWIIWSNEHQGWWKPGSMGYTNNRSEAGHYRRTEAENICRDANKHIRDDDPPQETMLPA